MEICWIEIMIDFNGAVGMDGNSSEAPSCKVNAFPLSLSFANDVDTSSPAHRRLRLMVSIPALNEEITIGQVISVIQRENSGVEPFEVVVAEDGSTD